MYVICLISDQSCISMPVKNILKLILFLFASTCELDLFAKLHPNLCSSCSSSASSNESWVYLSLICVALSVVALC